MSSTDRGWRDRFRAPRPAARMLKIVHGWPYQPVEQASLLTSLKTQGYGGVVTNISFGDGYVESERNWQALTGALDRLRAEGLTVWLYDEAGYPSGRAGTMTLRGHPELEAQGLMIVRREVGPGPVEMEVPTGRLLLAAAFPLSAEGIVLEKRMDLPVRDRRLAWTAPEGRWSVMAVTTDRLYEGTQVAVSGVPERTPYAGLLEAETGRRFVALTHDRYADHLGADLGSRFTATFTDEPSTMAIFFNRMPWATLPWCADFPDAFRKRQGYDLLPVLPYLVADGGDRARRVRYDFYRTISDLMVERWWEPLRTWCKAHGIASGGHLLLEENILHHVPLYGDAFTAFRHMDSTGIDCLSSDPSVPRYRSMAGMGADVPWNAARLASSAAELDHKPLVMCEVSEHIQRMANPPVKLAPEQYRGTWNRLLLGGINVFTSYTGFEGWTDAQIRAANDYLGRCVEALSGGQRVSEIAVLYPIESVWTRFTPSDLWVEQANAECRRIEETLRDLSEALYRSRREFDYIDAQTLAKGKVEDGALAHGGKRWRVLILPGVDTLPEAAWRKLEAFHTAGGTVVLLGATPRNSEKAFPSDLAARTARKLREGARPARFLPADETDHVPALLGAVLPAVMHVGPADAPLRMTHRRIGRREVYFVINDGAARWSGRVTVPGGVEQVLDPVTGDVRSVSKSGPVELDLPAYGAALLVREGAKAR